MEYSLVEVEEENVVIRSHDYGHKATLHNINILLRKYISEGNIYTFDWKLREREDFSIFS